MSKWARCSNLAIHNSQSQFLQNHFSGQKVFVHQTLISRRHSTDCIISASGRSGMIRPSPNPMNGRAASLFWKQLKFSKDKKLKQFIWNSFWNFVVSFSTIWTAGKAASCHSRNQISRYILFASHDIVPGRMATGRIATISLPPSPRDCSLSVEGGWMTCTVVIWWPSS